MRLTSKQITVIKEALNKYFGTDAKVWLFGSRVDDSKRGGDIDLYIETTLESAKKTVEARVRFLVEIKLKLDDQKIDVVLKQKDSPEELLIYKIAKETGIQL